MIKQRGPGTPIRLLRPCASHFIQLTLSSQRIVFIMVTNFVLSVSSYSIRVAPAWSWHRIRSFCVFYRARAPSRVHTAKSFLNVYHMMLKVSIPIVVRRSPRCLSVPYRPVGCWREPFTDRVACMLWYWHRPSSFRVLLAVEDA